MKVSTSSRSALCASTAAALLAACGGSQPPIAASGAMVQSRNIASNHTIAGDSVEAAASPYHVLYSFGGPPDAGFPEAGLIDVNDTLYGTTLQGGTYAYTCEDTTYYEFGCGTVFSITKSLTEKVLYSFRNGTDGAYPIASLININGTLYGTTTGGGGGDCYPAYSCGTVFSITTAGSEKVLHSFDGSDGESPSAALLDVNNHLYGTTYEGGKYSGCRTSGYQGCGTVFNITIKGNRHLLYSFSGGTNGRILIQT
ncbi:MAG: choice-of-anchor tandem repeat GloVer-containing protein [Candidatus Cybelea sp.]